MCIFVIQLNRADDLKYNRDRRGRDRVVGEYATTCAISAHHHWNYEFEQLCIDSSNGDFFIL
jgi:hypothetical protein